MKRLHLLEIHDQPWCPAPVREGLTDLLCLYINRLNAFGAAMPRLIRAMELAESTTIIDLCSGGGGPWPSLLRQLEHSDSQVEQIILTDLYPNLPALHAVQNLAPDKVAIEEKSVDILAVPPHLKGFRTQFNAFHHFQPGQARAILQDAVDCGEGIAIFELAERSLQSVASMAVMSPLAALWGPPLMRPLRPAQWLWTYWVPALPVTMAIDGIVSCLRAYTPMELQAMVAELDAPGYRWEIGMEGWPFKVTYLIGHPPGAGT